jgi:hypothetical protein
LSAVWLHGDQLSVEVRPERGADITSIIDRETSIDVLFHAPIGRPDLASAPSTGDSRTDWLARYGGGWQQLIPNAGEERIVDGVRRGFHGEAAVVEWSVESESSFGVELDSAPLRLTRTLALDGPTLTVTDTVRNISDDPVRVMWVQHPGFGAPFLDDRCVLRTPARTVITDADPPKRSAFPAELSRIPGPRSGRSLLVYLTDFDTGWFAIDSPSAGLTVRLEWDAALLPHAWLWQECNASTDSPWHGRAYVVGVEPANVVPGEPGPTLAGGAGLEQHVDADAHTVVSSSGRCDRISGPELRTTTSSSSRIPPRSGL